MKIIILCSLTLFVLTSVCCQPKSRFKEVDHSNIDKSQLEFATELSQKILVKQRNGTYHQLTEDEATPQMIEGLNQSIQQSSYKQIKTLFGDFKGLKFSSVMEPIDNSGMKIYRFKGDFESNIDTEIRTVMDKEGKLAGFFVKFWNEEL